MFVGRQRELKLLEDRYRSLHAELVVMTGRRRIGKSALAGEFSRGKRILRFEGLEGERTRAQMDYFTACLKRQIPDPILESVRFGSWDAAFAYLTRQLPDKGEKTVVFFDELQWMAAGRGKLVSFIKTFWDNEWKHKQVLLILCGSIASFMLDNVIRSKALYGRVTGEIRLKGLDPKAAKRLIGPKRSFNDILGYLLVFGGVPKYLEMIDANRSFNMNMNELCFRPEAVLLDEADKVFYSQFKKHGLYLKIVKRLKNEALTLKDVGLALGMPSGGGLQRYLKQLEDAEFIASFVSFSSNPDGKFKKYRLADEFLIFYFHFMAPHLLTIRESRSPKLFELVTRKNWDVWCGLAFERFCLKHSHLIAEAMGFSDEILSAAPYFHKGDSRFQVDLLYRRADQVITLCEIKYNREPVGTKVIPAVERKIGLFPLPRGYTLEKALIHVGGVSDALRESEYFHHLVAIGDIF